MSSIPTWENEIFHIFISPLWCRGKGVEFRHLTCHASRIHWKIEIGFFIYIFFNNNNNNQTFLFSSLLATIGHWASSHLNWWHSEDHFLQVMTTVQLKSLVIYKSKLFWVFREYYNMLDSALPMVYGGSIYKWFFFNYNKIKRFCSSYLYKTISWKLGEKLWMDCLNTS